MSSASDRSGPARAWPRLRPVEIIRVPGKNGDFVTVLRDPERIALRIVEVVSPLDRTLALMDGRHDATELARLVGHRVHANDVDALIAELEAAAMLEGPTAATRRRALHEAFAASPVREEGFAGGSYHGNPQELGRFIDGSFAKASSRALDAGAGTGSAKNEGEIRALIAPHMDLWRAADGYALAYESLGRHLPDDLDLVVVLGTCHAGMRAPFALTKKAFRTPYGTLQTDAGVVERLGSRSRFNVLADEYKHAGEHSIEFQIVYLQHVLGERSRHVRILPVLCGLGRAQSMRLDPHQEAEAASFLGALLEELSRRSVLIVAGADLAHVGPRFGDDRALDDGERRSLADRDRESIRRLLDQDAPGFFDHVTEDIDVRRVCGTGPIYTLLRALEALGTTESELFGYTQHVDPDEGSIVSHASAAFYRRTS